MQVEYISARKGAPVPGAARAFMAQIARPSKLLKPTSGLSARTTHVPGLQHYALRDQNAHKPFGKSAMGPRQLLALRRTRSSLSPAPDMPLHSADQRDGKRRAQTDKLLDTINRWSV